MTITIFGAIRSNTTATDALVNYARVGGAFQIYAYSQLTVQDGADGTVMDSDRPPGGREIVPSSHPVGMCSLLLLLGQWASTCASLQYASKSCFDVNHARNCRFACCVVQDWSARRHELALTAH